MSEKDAMIGNIRRHSRNLMRELDVVKGIFLDTGYTYAQCHLLFELSQNSKTNTLQLAEKLLLDKSNTSRMVKRLVEHGMVRSVQSTSDQRQRELSLTAKGRKLIDRVNALADEQVSEALSLLSPTQQETVVEGMGLYAKALRKIRLQAGYSIREIQKKDNPFVAQVIRDVMTEYGAVGEGYSIVDKEVDDMFGNYRDRGSCYFVLVQGNTIVGGGGIGQLKGAAKSICELRKMFFLPQVRGIGLGKKLLLHLLDEAKKRGYKKCYLETLDRMERANQLYKSCGFVPLEKTVGNTGHCSCDRYYMLEL